MTYNIKGSYNSKDKNKDSIPSGLFDLSFYEKEQLLFSFTVISENAIRIGEKRFELDNKIDLTYIEKILEGLEIVK